MVSNYCINDWNAALLGSTIINTIVFSIAARYLFLITLKVTGSRNFSHRTWLMFCISPATVFFLAPYSEALFCALTFAGIHHCLCQNFLPASAFFTLSAATRSNGWLNIGHMWYQLLLIVFMSSPKEKQSRKKHRILTTISKIKSNWRLGLKILALSAFSVSPFVLYQWFAYNQFCRLYPNTLPQPVKEWLSSEGAVVAGSSIAQWCNDWPPISYTFVQSSYWGVGFLRYYKLKQVPNFLLATPMLALVSLYTVLSVLSLLKSLKSVRSTRPKPTPVVVPEIHPIFGLQCFSFAVHSAFLAIYILLCAHVQVWRNHF